MHALIVVPLLLALTPAQQKVETNVPKDQRAAPKEKLRRASFVAEDAAAVRLMTKAWEVRVDAAVGRGLSWLAEKQNKRGFWIGLVGDKEGSGYVPLRSLAEQRRAGTGHLGVTALCGMAFLAGGHLPNRGKYGSNVQKTVDAVLSCIQENGIVSVAGSRMYSHAFATLFLAEVYGMSRDRRIREGLERATHIIVDSQNHQGGWRYNAFSLDSDISITVCQLQALRAARNIGIQIPKSTIDRAVAYVKGSRIDYGRYKGRYTYKLSGRARKTNQYSIQAAAVTSLVSAGVYDRELIEPVLDFLTEEMPNVSERWPHHYYFWYGNYYASQAFFHAEDLLQDGCFRRYYIAIRDHLLADQQEDGRWLNPQTDGPGDPFGTAVACIILQIPKQYLPIFQR
ncbi:MAG: prenyltransferase/squalene oxidase repeat-containing protein [Planctomycetota bacterium]